MADDPKLIRDENGTPIFTLSAMELQKTVDAVWHPHIAPLVTDAGLKFAPGVDGTPHESYLRTRPGGDLNIIPTKPMDIESYRQERMFYGKHSDQVTQADRDASRQTHQASNVERPTDQRQLDLQLEVNTKTIER